MTDDSTPERHGLSPLTIVGYHYVRPIAESRYPAIKGREVAQFRDQMRFLARHYHFVSVDDVVTAANDGKALPSRPLLMTFDDGYRDHYSHVFPVLREFGAQGAFYPPTAAVMERRVLDVNKVHFVLASVGDPTALIAAIEAAIVAAGSEGGAGSVREYRERYWIGNRFDPAPVLYCKQLLQHGLPESFRHRLVDELFCRFVTSDAASFADDLYLGVEELQTMRAAGMHIGGHGGQHFWLDRLTAEEQQRDIADSLRLLQAIWQDTEPDVFTFCYPYGGYNADTLQLLRKARCLMGLTVRPDLAYLHEDPMLELPRLDTNDLPAHPDAAPGEWTVAASRRRAVSRVNA